MGETRGLIESRGEIGSPSHYHHQERDTTKYESRGETVIRARY